MIRLLLLSSTSFPSDVVAITVPSGAASSGALAAFPSAVPMSAPDILGISLAIAALILALVAIAMAVSLGRATSEEDNDEYSMRDLHRPPTQIFTSFERDEDDR